MRSGSVISSMSPAILSSEKWSRITSSAAQKWPASSSVLIPIWSFWPTSAPNLPTSANHFSKGLSSSRGWEGQKAYSRYLRETIRPCLERLHRVRESQVSASFQFMASHEGLEGLLVLPEMNQEQVKRLSTLVSVDI